MQKMLKNISLSLLVIGMSGCAINRDALQRSELSVPYQKPHIVVSSELSEYRLAKNSVLDKSTLLEVKNWLINQNAGKKHKLLITHPASLSEVAVIKLQRVAIESGLNASHIRHHIEDKEAVLMTLILDVTAVPNCTTIIKHKMTETETGYSENFGCASTKNLALMVVEPRDLVLGRTLISTSSVRAVSATQSFNKGQVVNFEDNSFEAGGN